jgi:hypothetical protein
MLDFDQMAAPVPPFYSIRTCLLQTYRPRTNSHVHFISLGRLSKEYVKVRGA